MSYKTVKWLSNEYIVDSNQDVSNFHPADALGIVTRSRKSKSFYITLPEVSEQIRISDHWYSTGTSSFRGSAGKYTKQELDAYVADGEAVVIKDGYYWLTDSYQLLYLGDRKPTVKQAIALILKAINND